MGPRAWTVAALTLPLLVGGSATQAQEPDHRRFVVVVPDLLAIGDADRRFGRDVAEELQELLNTLDTHEAMSRRDIERALDDVDRDMRDADCTLTRQLGSLVDAQVVLCADYTEFAEDQFRVSATFYDVASGEAFTVPETTGTRRGSVVTAGHIFNAFDGYVRFLRAAANCEGYAQSRQWPDALRNCDEALSLNPDAIEPRYRRARILFDSERPEESLQEVIQVLDRSPAHEAGLQLAGYISASLGDSEAALGFYSTYLEFNPGNTLVRMNVAYDLARAGDIASALLLIREGLDLDPTEPRLWEQMAVYSVSIAESLHRETAEDSGALSPDAAQHYRNAVDAYDSVFALRGTEVDSAHVHRAMTAHLRLSQPNEAVTLGTYWSLTFPDDPVLWSIYADALRGADRLEDALVALARVAELDPDYPNLGLRRGNWMLEEGRIQEAYDVLLEVAQNLPDRADAASRLILAHAHQNGIQEDRFEYAVAALILAKSLPNLSETTLHELNFWHAYGAFRQAVVVQQPRTLETARRTLPDFQEVSELLDSVGEYPESVGVDISELRANVSRYIDIQEAIIRRGGPPG